MAPIKPIRPPLNRQTPKRSVPKQRDGFDIAKEARNIANMAFELENLRKKFVSKIEALENETEETRKNSKQSISQEIRRVSDDFSLKATQIIFSLEARLEVKFKRDFNAKLVEVNKLFEHILKVQKGDKGDRGKKGDKGDKPLPDIDFQMPKDGDDAEFTFEMFIDFVSKLPEGKKFKISDIENLDRILREIGSKSAAPSGGGQGSWKQKALTGDIDSVNKIFTFVGDPPAEFSERVFLNYIEQNPFTDYTIVGSTITYTDAPHSSLSAFPHIIRYM